MTDMLIQPTADLSGDLARQRVEEVDGYLTCTAVTDVTHDVKSFEFELPGPGLLHFLPGQYLTFRFRIDGAPVERCYTISSAATRPGRLTITVKRMPGGVVSTWLHDRFRVGDALGASGPNGVFSAALHPAERYLFLTAGSGITPAMSMVRTMRDTGAVRDVVLVHCARTPADIIFRDELDLLAGQDGVRVVTWCEEDAPSETWRGRRGRLTAAALQEAAPDVAEREVFTCGPPPFMAAVRELLAAAGVTADRAHEESFVLGAGRPGDSADSADSAGATTGTTYRVDFRRSGAVVDCGATTTILDAAARAGIALPSSCGEGMCGTCKLSLLSGEVDMDHAGGIRPREIAQGRILACCATPTGDVVVDA